MRGRDRLPLIATLLTICLSLAVPSFAQVDDNDSAAGTPARGNQPSAGSSIRSPQDALAYYTRLRQRIMQGAIIVVPEKDSGTMMPVKYGVYARMRRMRIILESRSPRESATRQVQLRNELADMQTRSVRWVDQQIQTLSSRSAPQ